MFCDLKFHFSMLDFGLMGGKYSNSVFVSIVKWRLKKEIQFVKKKIAFRLCLAKQI